MPTVAANSINESTTGVVTFSGTAFSAESPVTIAHGGTDATSFSTSTGIVKYDGTRLVTSTTALIDSSNRTTNASQPAFLAYLSASIPNASGNGAFVSLGTGTAFTEVFDQNSNFNTNGTFTAPVTGIYHFDFGVLYANCTIASLVQVFLLADGVTYNFQNGRGASASNFSLLASTTIPMTASSTAVVSTNSVGEAGDTDTLIGGSNYLTFFAGYLVC